MVFSPHYPWTASKVLIEFMVWCQLFAELGKDPPNLIGNDEMKEKAGPEQAVQVG